MYKAGRHYSDLSVRAYQELVKEAPDSAYVFALAGEEKYKERQYASALEAYGEALQRMPDLRGLHTAIAQIYTSLGKQDQAAAHNDAEKSLGVPDCAVHRSECEFLAGRFQAIVAEDSTKHDPEDLYWLTRAAEELAIQSFAELSKFPNSAEYREFRGEMLFVTEDYKGVLPELKKLLKAEPNSAKLSFFVGHALLETEQIEEAVPYLESALKIDPKLRPADVSLGLCYMRLGEPQKAISHLENGLPLDSDGTLYYQLARAYQATGQPERAKSMMEKYQELQQRARANEPAR